MSALGSLLLQYPQFKGTDLPGMYTSAMNYSTNLLALQEAQRQRDVAAEARATIAANPDLVLGGGAQPLLASGALTQTTTRPADALMGTPATSATQTVPAPPNLSQFATGTPPGGMAQPVLGGLSPQAEPIRALMQRSPDAAFAVMQQQQAVQDRAYKIREQNLMMQEKAAGFIGQMLQGANDQASYERSKEQIRRVFPEWAAALPQTYSKEALTPYIKQAVDVKTNATLAIQNMQAQAEIGKYNLQLQNAGYQGLGTAVTDVLKGLTDEQVAKFGGRTSAAAIEYANKEVQRKKLEEAGEAERQKQVLGQQFQETQPLQDARKEDSGLFVYKGTGQTVPGTLKYGEVKALQDENDPTKGVVKLANLDEKKQLTTLKQLEPVLQQYADLVQYAYGPGGPLEHYSRSPGSVINTAVGQAMQSDPVFQAKRRALQGQLQSVVRGLGARGDLNEQELAAAKEMIANMDASMGLGLNLGVGPMVGTGGAGVGATIGVKPTISIPDTPETGINLANELIGTVNRRIGSILQHEGYQKTPFITLRTEQQGQEPTGDMPKARPGAAPSSSIPGVPPRTWGVMPPATPGQPQSGQGTPPALPEVPSTRPTPPPASPSPGRQSQAPPTAGPTRVAQVPVSQRFMDQADVVEAMRQTGRSRREVEDAARARGYTVYGSKLPLPGETMVG